MRRALILLAALALGAAPLTAGATTAPTLTLAQQARKADVIVRATLGTPTNVTEGEATWVTYPLTVTETVAGDPATLPQREGRPVLYVLSGLEDLPELRAGQEAFLLLYSRRMDNPIVGFAQGVYPIVNGRVTRSGEAAGTNGTGAGTGASTASGSTTPSGSAATTTGTEAATSTAGGAPTSGTGTASSTTAPGSGTATTAPGTSTSGTATATAPGTAPSTTTPGAGATSPTAGGATTSSTATGSTPSATASGPGAATPTATPTPTTTSPASGNATTPTTTAPPVNDPASFPSDPARFRDALRAAREGR